eukprot:GHVN01020131.1.p1 GENE.GHVN01020131.1~~GHVN01020131.1.p1  ORF type:complete len:1030 (-),score=254.15 GHVN01020131.1:300-3389(-)
MVTHLNHFIYVPLGSLTLAEPPQERSATLCVPTRLTDPRSRAWSSLNFHPPGSPSSPTTSRQRTIHLTHSFSQQGSSSSSGYTHSAGLHGVGLSVVNALSEWLVANVVRGGKEFEVKCQKGAIVQPLTQRDLAERSPDDDSPLSVSSTSITFKPDKTVLSVSDFDAQLIGMRLTDLGYLFPGANFTLTDFRKHRSNKEQYFDPISKSMKLGNRQWFTQVGGLRDYVSHHMMTKLQVSPLVPDAPIISIGGRWSPSTPSNSSSASLSPDSPNHAGSIDIEVHLIWSSGHKGEVIKSFANGVGTTEGGTHVDGLRTALAKAVNAHAREKGLLDDAVLTGAPPTGMKQAPSHSLSLGGDFIREGVVACVSVMVEEAIFSGQTKARLGNNLVREVVTEVVDRQLHRAFDANPKMFKAVLENALSAHRAARVARRAKEVFRLANFNRNAILPGKLADCSTDNRSESELFIVEGESAAGSAKQGRDRRFQAILPIKGKILNIERNSHDIKQIQSKELQALVAAIGLNAVPARGIDGIDSLQSPQSPQSNQASPMDRLNGLRYGKVILMTDADVDGAHIRALLLTFLYRHEPELIHRGLCYVAHPPLYKVTFPKKLSQLVESEMEARRRLVGGRDVGHLEVSSDQSEGSDVSEVAGRDGLVYRFDGEKGYCWSEATLHELVNVCKRVKGKESSLVSDMVGVSETNEVDDYHGEINLSEKSEGETNEATSSLLVYGLSDLPSGVHVQRFKGLGEMMPAELWATTMDKKKRVMKRMDVSDPAHTDLAMSVLMGTDTTKRKEYIMTRHSTKKNSAHQLTTLSALDNRRSSSSLNMRRLSPPPSSVSFPQPIAVIQGVAFKGRQLGRTIGVPTVNIRWSDASDDKKVNGVGEERQVEAMGEASDGVMGVYTAQLRVLKRAANEDGSPHSSLLGDFMGVVNVGRRPTIEDNGDVWVEAHILLPSNTTEPPTQATSFSPESAQSPSSPPLPTYGDTVSVSLLHKLRDEVKFTSLSSLTEQMDVDKGQARQWWKERLRLGRSE